MSFKQYVDTLRNPNAAEALKKVIDAVNIGLTVSDVVNILDLAKASIVTGSISEIKNPTIDDVQTIINKRLCAGPLIENFRLRDASNEP